MVKITIMSDKSQIPPSIYCYTWIKFPSEENNWRGKTKFCPFYSFKEINGVKIPWCSYLNLGGMDNNWNEEDWNKVRSHYKTEEEMDKELPLFLLWDACKECDENLEEEIDKIK